MELSTSPRRSVDWQSQAHTARRQRGFVDAPISLSHFEQWTLETAYRITGVPASGWLKLCAVCEDWTITRIEIEVAALSYDLDQARKCDLHSLEHAEATAREYGANIRQRLHQIEGQTRSDWSALEGARQ